MKLSQLSDKRMYEALVQRDSQFEGIFIVGVKTTGIFCRPTCTAKKPKFENVEFFETVKEALQEGYRACKVCNPLKSFGEPEWLADLLHLIKSDPSKKWKDYELTQSGFSPSKIRRYFKKTYGITFHSYLRMNRINEAFTQIKQGKSVTKSAFQSGYESLSGFADSYKKLIGSNPSKTTHMITIDRISTPLGPMMVGAMDKGLCLLEFTDRRMLERQLEILEKRTNARMISGNHPYIEQTKTELAEYFEGKRKTFDIPLVIPGTEFQNKVWDALREIPFGITRSYKQQAGIVGNLKAVRAVARANGENRISIIIPCHRIIGADGSIVGYGGGIQRKQWLLKHEFENS